jgi:hypothetical protein
MVLTCSLNAVDYLPGYKGYMSKEYLQLLYSVSCSDSVLCADMWAKGLPSLRQERVSVRHTCSFALIICASAGLCVTQPLAPWLPKLCVIGSRWPAT